MMNDELSFRRFVPTEARIPIRLARCVGFSWAKPSCYESAMHRLVFIVLNHAGSPAAQPLFPWLRLTLHADLELAGADEVRQD